MRKVTITVDEHVLPGLRDYFAEGVDILSEEDADPEMFESVKATLNEIDAAMETLYNTQGD